MRKVLIALTAASLLALSGCATQEAAKPAPTITAGAQAALDAAKAAQKAADAKEANWTTAEDALKKAEEAAKKGDSASVIKFATEAKEQSEMGLKQTTYPVLQLKDL